MNSEFDWQYREGRDSDGEKFCVWVMVHGSGRIYAKVSCPRSSDEYTHRTFFILKPELDKEEYQFIDADSAKAFAEKTISELSPAAVDPVEPPKISLLGKLRRIILHGKEHSAL